MSLLCYVMADQATFVEDTEPFMASLYSTAVRLTGNRTDAEDLVQETYLRAYRSYGGFQEGTNLRAWLFRILTNAHINRYRARKRRPDETELDDIEDLYLYRRVQGSTRYGQSAEDRDDTRPGFGIGLTNVRERLDARFGKEATVVSGHVPGGYATHLRMPLMRMKERVAA